MIETTPRCLKQIIRILEWEAEDFHEPVLFDVCKQLQKQLDDEELVCPIQKLLKKG